MDLESNDTAVGRRIPNFAAQLHSETIDPDGHLVMRQQIKQGAPVATFEKLHQCVVGIWRRACVFNALVRVEDGAGERVTLPSKLEPTAGELEAVAIFSGQTARDFFSSRMIRCRSQESASWFPA